MKILNEIKAGYQELFLKTGNPYFFMMSQNLNKLIEDVKNIDKVQEVEQGLEL